ncbi:MAG: radical SAM protein [Negativicutes bacterium]|nr:radical SAM protein [Negativicutes bacterium]MDR3591304.1 radical SAM protein [Negativicutes bacterium]
MKHFDQVEIVKVALTHRCNLACFYCSDNLSKNKTGEFMAEEECVKWLTALPRLRMVTLYGGEPLLSTRCIEFANRILQEIPFPVRVAIFTNGTIINDEIRGFLANPRAVLNLTRSSDPVSQDVRKFKADGRSSRAIVSRNAQEFYRLCGPRLVVVDTLLPDSLGRLAHSIISGFESSDFVELNLIRSEVEFTAFDLLATELDQVVAYLLDHPGKCFKNFSKRPPLDPEFKRDWYRFIQGTYTDYANGIRNILIDVDGKIYPGTSVAGRGLAMGDIFGRVNDSYYHLFADGKDDCDCEYKYMCVPNYENYNPDNLVLPFKQPSHCRYFKTVAGAMAKYYQGLKVRGML